MGLLRSIGKRLGLTYEAAEETPRRKAPSTRLQSEDAELPAAKRAALVATTRDLLRNYSAAKWAVGKHLDYVSSFTFQSRNGIKGLDDRIEELMRRWSHPKNCDVTNRHPLERLIRLVESRATVDGDCWMVKLQSGHTQIIEGDRVRTPTGKPAGVPDGEIVDGVVLDAAGAPLGICVHRRIGSRFEFERFLPAENVCQHGYFDRYDQVRGISPLASGLNTFRDVLEASVYALIKAKIVALFGIKIKRSEVGADGTVGQETDSSYDVDFGKAGWMLDLAPGDDAEFMESGHPSTQFQDYMNMGLGVALKSLDIPFSFYDEAYTNYSGARQALVMYNQSAEVKRNALRRLLACITFWKLTEWIATDRLYLPDNWTVYDLRWEWIATGLPWIDPLKEISADISAINSGLTSRQIICRERGQDFFEIADQLQAEQAYLQQLGVQTKDTPITLTIVEGGNK